MMLLSSPSKLKFGWNAILVFGLALMVTPASASDDTALLGASAAAIEGDAEYGEYLAGECVTCHKLDGDNEGIPTFIGWPKEYFIDALYQYKSEKRDNPVMVTVAKRLGDEEMAALAAYYSSLSQE